MSDLQSSILELDFGDLTNAEASELEIAPEQTVVIYLPLDSIGYTNQHIDICDDLLEAIWAGERLAAQATKAEVKRDYPPGTHKTQLRLTLQGLSPGLKTAIHECAVLYNRGEGDDADEAAAEQYSAMRDAVLDLEDDLNGITARLPQTVDDYFANLVGGAYCQMRYEAPERYREQISRYPERRVGYWRSAFSGQLGANCFTSSDGWMIPTCVELDTFFRITGQKFKFNHLLPAKVLTVNSVSYAIANGMTAFFPMGQYFKSRICGSIALLEEDDHWPPDTFDWSDASFTYSPHREFNSAGIADAMLAPPPRVEGCLIDPSGSLIVVDDGQFRHLLYDTNALTLDGMKTLFNAVGEVSLSLAASIGLATNPACDWASLNDEQFEQLCYDLIYSHPLFNSSTIRKHGKSRSRDGGRDIEVYDIPRLPSTRPRKWIFQCKLVTGSASLSATKLVDIGDMLDHYAVEGFGVMTSAPIDATLYDKLDAVCGKRRVEQMNFSVLELERELVRNEFVRRRYFAT